MSEHWQRRLINVETGGFRLECSRGATIQVTPQRDALTVSGGTVVHGWCIRDEDEGFRLERDDGKVAGQSLRARVAEGLDAAVSLLLDDGRLFRIVLRGPRDARYELTGWETPGAYFEARPADDGWTIAATVAGTAMEDVEPLILLFAAEIVHSEEEV